MVHPRGAGKGGEATAPNPEAERKSRTLFVRGVSYDAGDKDLESFFSDVGPISRAFVVREGKEGQHKGFGFVQFALQEDAAKAAAKLDGKTLLGRRLRVEVSRARASLEERKKKRIAGGGKGEEVGADGGDGARGGEGSAPEAAEAGDGARAGRREDKRAVAGSGRSGVAGASRGSGTAVAGAKKQRKSFEGDFLLLPEGASDAEKKHAWVRTVAVGVAGGGAATADATRALELCAEAATAAGGAVASAVGKIPPQVSSRYHLDSDGCPEDGALVTFTDVASALAAVGKVHGARLASGKSLWARQVSGDGLYLKRWRVVVRNLPFSANERALRKALREATERKKGKPEAAEAEAEGAGPTSASWLSPRSVDVPKDASTGRPRGFAFVGFDSRAQAERAVRALNGREVGGRVVAVDWAVSKKKYEAGEDAVAPPGGASGEDEASKKLEELLGLESENDSSSNSDSAYDSASEDGSEADYEVKSGAGGDTDVSRSVLASLLAGEDGGGDGEAKADGDGSEADTEEEGEEAEEEEVEEEVEEEEGEGDGEPPSPPPAMTPEEERKARVAAARKAALPKTVFVRGLALDTNDEQLRIGMGRYGPVRFARLVVDRASGRPKGTAFVEFYSEAGAEAAAAATAAAREKRGGGVAVGGRAVEVDRALDAEGARGKATETGELRDDKARDRRNLRLAKEGLVPEGSEAWHQLSDSDKAKRARAAEEMRTKLRSPNFAVSATRLSIRNLPYSWTEAKLREAFSAAVLARASKAKPVVKQAKILLDSDKVDQNGLPRSKGIAFIEFEDHEHALCALREMNNSSTAFGTRDRRPIVEFAIDDTRVLRAREARLARQQQPRRGAPGGSAPAEAPAAADADAAPADGAARAGRKRPRDAAADGAAAPARPAESEGEGASAEAGAGPPKTGKSARRREQRKRRALGDVAVELQKGTAALAAGKHTAEKSGKAASSAGRAAAAATRTASRAAFDAETDELAGGRGTTTAPPATRAKSQRPPRKERLAAKMAVSGRAGAGPRPRAQGKPRAAADTDAVERAAEDYKRRLFGGDAGGKKAAGGLGKWFEE